MVVSGQFVPEVRRFVPTGGTKPCFLFPQAGVRGDLFRLFCCSASTKKKGGSMLVGIDI